MRRIGELSNGNIVVEMTPREWFVHISGLKTLFNLPRLCKSYRTKHKLSQGALAKRAGISRNYLACIEKGGANVSLKIYLKLLAATTVEEVRLER